MRSSSFIPLKPQNYKKFTHISRNKTWTEQHFSMKFPVEIIHVEALLRRRLIRFYENEI